MKFFQSIGRAGKAFILLFIFALLLGTLVLGGKHFVESYNLLEAEETTATIVAKTEEKGLFQLPAYYMKVDKNDVDTDVYEGVLSRATSRQMNMLDIGDELPGYLISGQHFLTLYDIVTDGILVLIALLVILIIIVGFIVGAVISTKASPRKKQAKVPKKKKRKRQPTGKRKRVSISFVFLVVVFTIAGLFSVSALINGAQKILPLGKTSTEAEIIAKHSEREWLFEPIFYDQTDDPIYEFTLVYFDESGKEHRMIKEVTPHTYDEYEIAETISVAYRNNNPFNLFIQDMTSTDLFEIMLYWEFYIYAAVIGIGLLVILIKVRDRIK